MMPYITPCKKILHYGSYGVVRFGVKDIGFDLRFGPQASGWIAVLKSGVPRML